MTETPKDRPQSCPQPVRIAWGSPYKAPSVLVGPPDSEQLITDASRVTVDCPAGQAPKIFLEFDQEVEDIALEGVVYIVKEQVGDPLQILAGWLEDLSPIELERATLELQTSGGPQTFGEAVLEVLKRWARGQS